MARTTDADQGVMLQAEGLAERLRKIRRRIKQLEGKTINAADNHDPTSSSVDIINTRSLGAGNAADYLTARLKRLGLKKGTENTVRTKRTERGKRDTKAEDARSTAGQVAAKAGVSLRPRRQRDPCRCCVS